MSQFFLKLFRRKRSIDSLTIRVKDGVCTGRSRLSGSRAGVQPQETDQTHDKEHRSEPTSDEPRPHYQPHSKFHREVQVRM